LEASQRKRGAALQKQQEYLMKRERFKNEDGTLMRKIEAGELTEEEAHKHFVRMKMQRKTDADTTKPQLDPTVAAGADYTTTDQMLEEWLDTESRAPLVRWLKGVTGIRKLETKVAREKNMRARADYMHRCAWLKWVVDTMAFEMFLGVLMFMNGITIGIQASEKGDPQVVQTMEHIFTTIFVLEIIIRIVADGWIWLFELKNALDTGLILVTGVLPLWILQPLNVKSSAMRAFQVLRVLRLVRLVKIVRTWNIFQIFWSLIRGLIDSGRTLIWTYVMIIFVLFIFAVFGVDLIAREDLFADDELAHEYFGTVPRAFISLFQTSTLDSWAAVCRPLMRKKPLVCIYFLLVIFIVTMALFNLITAVIVNNAFDSAQKDHELNAKNKKENQLKEINELRDIFAEIDVNGDQMLSREEFQEAVLYNERVKQKLDILEIGPDEVGEVWDLLDPGNGELHVTDFADGLRAMQGDAKAKSSFTIVKRVMHLDTRIQQITERIQTSQSVAEDLRDKTDALHKQMGGVMLELREFLNYMTPTVPVEACTRTRTELESLPKMLADRAQQAKDDRTNEERTKRMRNA